MKPTLGLPNNYYLKLKRLNTPIKIQNFLDSFHINHETDGETYMSPLRTLRHKSMHCFEGALVAALALWVNGQKPLILDLKTKADYDHVVALYQVNGWWGAISKSNHATLRWRDPVYKTIRELAVSYFHEYFDNDTFKKTLVSYSAPINLAKFKLSWVAAKENLFWLVKAIDNSKHFQIYPPINKPFIRPADKIERQAGKIVEWPNMC